MNSTIIAFYLPQFYPCKENDEWWGKGFTEWTNVGKAKPLFKGHDQPRVPTTLGYYDLRIPAVRQQQADLAKCAGIDGFCYWHYWFGNSKRLLTDVFDDVLESGHPDFPFCLGWANHSWYAKTWNKDSKKKGKLLIKQEYPGIEDNKAHFSYLLKAFKDKRYIKVDNSPLFYIFDPTEVPNDYILNLRKWTKEAGFKDLFIVGRISESSSKTKEELIKLGYTAVNYERLSSSVNKLFINLGYLALKLRRLFLLVKGYFKRMPSQVFDYRYYYESLIVPEIDGSEDVIPSIIPQWDHSPRSGMRGSIFINATPEYFYKLAKRAFNVIKNKKVQRQIIFVKSWNEWAEGNYMEPDITNGDGFIKALKRAKDESKNQ